MSATAMSVDIPLAAVDQMVKSTPFPFGKASGHE
jgi:hypothetical protein